MSALTTGQIILVGCFAMAYRLAPIACQALQPRRAQPQPGRKDKAEAARRRRRTLPQDHRRPPTTRQARMPYRRSQLHVVVVKLPKDVRRSTKSSIPSSSGISTPTPAVQTIIARSESGRAVEDHMDAAEGPELADWPLPILDTSPDTRYIPATPNFHPTARPNTQERPPGVQHEPNSIGETLEPVAEFDEDLRSIGYWLISPGIPEARYAPHRDLRDRPPVFGFPGTKHTHSTVNEAVPHDHAENDSSPRPEARKPRSPPLSTGEALHGEQSRGHSLRPPYPVQVEAEPTFSAARERLE